MCVREKQQANAMKHIADKILIELLDSAQEHTHKKKSNKSPEKWGKGEWRGHGMEGIGKFTSWGRDGEREFKSEFS